MFEAASRNVSQPQSSKLPREYGGTVLEHDGSTLGHMGKMAWPLT